MWYKILTHFVPRFSADKFRYKMREYFLQTISLIHVVSLMVGKKYSRIFCCWFSPTSWRKYVRISYNDFLPIFSGTKYSHIFYQCFRKIFFGIKYSRIFPTFFGILLLVRSIFFGTKYSRIFYHFFRQIFSGTKYSRIFYH